MDLERIFYKTFQYRLNTYCLANQPYLSLLLHLNQHINSTYLQLKPLFYQMTKGDQWTKQFSIMLSNEKIPMISFTTIPFRYFSFDLITYGYSITISQALYSISLRFIQNKPIEYSLSYIPGTTPSFLGSLILGDASISARINEKVFSLFCKLNFNYKSFFFFGTKFTKNDSFWDSLHDIHVGFQRPIFNSIYLVGLGISNSVGFSISRRRKNRRLSYIIRSNFISEDDDFENSHYLQYKYICENRSKIGALYDFSENKLFVRGSLRFNNFKFKLSATYDGKWCNPTFGLNINF